VINDNYYFPLATIIIPSFYTIFLTKIKGFVGMWKSFFLAFPKDCGKLVEFSKQLWESRRDFHNCGNPGISIKLGAVEMWKTFS